MQVDSAAQGVCAIPRRRRLEGLLVIAAIVVIAALLVWVVPLTTNGLGNEDAGAGAGAASAIIHDDAGNMPSGVGSAVIHDDAGNMNPH